jgi:hypothetical protein
MSREEIEVDGEYGQRQPPDSLTVVDCESISSTVSEVQGRVGYKCQRERVRSAVSVRSLS